MTKVERKLLHRTSRAIADYDLIRPGDRIMVCLSGGKDSFTLLRLLLKLQPRFRGGFELHAYTLDQAQPGWDDTELRQWLETSGVPWTIERRDTHSIVVERIPAGKTYCSLCSRLRRGNIYRFAREHGFDRIALGHHRDDLIETVLLSMLYSGVTRSMPPKLLTDDRRNSVIRPLVYCQERDIIAYAAEQAFPIIPCNLCGSQTNLARQRIKRLIADLAADNPKVPSNLLSAIGNVQLSQMMDRRHWDFAALDAGRIGADEAADETDESPAPLPWQPPVG